MFVVCSRKMQEARNVGYMFILVLAFLLSNLFVSNINAYPQEGYQPAPEGYVDWDNYINPELGIHTEGDIVPFEEGRRSVLRNTNFRWPGGVVNYYLHHSLTRDPDKVRDLLLSLDVIRRYTKSTNKPCVTFNRVFENSLGRRNWVNITAHDRGCYSNVGRNPNGHNILNLNINDGCFNYIGHAMHEMMHTLGIYHEHSRPDRDKYVQVYYSNIIPEYRHNFNKYNDSFVTTFDYPYDYNSVMHYPTNAFARKRLYKTLEPIPNAQRPIGQRSILTVYDIYKIRNAYNCV